MGEKRSGKKNKNNKRRDCATQKSVWKGLIVLIDTKIRLFNGQAMRSGKVIGKFLYTDNGQHNEHVRRGMIGVTHMSGTLALNSIGRQIAGRKLKTEIGEERLTRFSKIKISNVSTVWLTKMSTLNSSGTSRLTNGNGTAERRRQRTKKEQRKTDTRKRLAHERR